jgi:hypothetical protein
MFTTDMYVCIQNYPSPMAPPPPPPPPPHVFTICRALHTDTIHHRLKTQVHLEVKTGENKHIFTSHQQNTGQKNHIT